MGMLFWILHWFDISVYAAVKFLGNGMLPTHSNYWQGCTILSGDVIIRHLAEQLRPVYVVFLVSFAGQ